MAGRQDIRLHALAFLAGVLCVQQLPVIPSLWWSLTLLPAGLAIRRWSRLGFMLVLMLGMTWTSFIAGLNLSQRLPAALEGVDVWVEGVVVDLPQYNPASTRFNFQVDQIELNNASYPAPGKIQLRWYDSQQSVVTGERWRLLVRLKRPRGFQNPGGFDYEGWLFQHRIRAQGYVKPHRDSMRLAVALSYAINPYRSRVEQFIVRALEDSPSAGIIAALAVGSRNGVSASQWQTLRRTGTSHLIAISGLHIGLVAGLGYWIGVRLWRVSGTGVLWFPAPKAGAVVALISGTLYAMLAGFSIPTQRALVMLVAVMLGVLLQRETRLSCLLGAALLAVLVFDPLAVMSAGFWLSFSAVAVIVYVAARTWSAGRAKWRRWGGVQLALGVGLFPILLVLFQHASLVGPVANAVAVPIVGFAVVPTTLIGVVAYGVGLSGPAQHLFGLAAGTLETIWPALVWLANQDYALWTQHQPPPWTLITAVVGTLLILAPKGFPARWIGIFWLAPMFLLRPAVPTHGEFEFSLLDVAQGLAAVVRTAHHVLVFDTGAKFGPRFDAGGAAVAPFLRTSGIHDVDVLIISHADNDHIGGMNSLLAGFAVSRRLTSVPDRVPQGVHCLAGQAWHWDGVWFEILNPVTALSLRDNDASCVLKVSGPFGSVLISGDIETDSEQALVATHRGGLHAAVLVAPHHGSATSSIPAFVDAVRPELALVSAGHRNRHGHPHPEVMARYAARAIPVLNTASSGAILIYFGEMEMRVSQYRRKAHRYWFAE